MSSFVSLPVISAENGLQHYMEQIKRFPLLTAKQEYDYGKRWQDHQDKKAAHQLITSHLRLVAKIAMGYRGYGLPVNDLIAEGNIGLMQAVRKFDPERGFRLSTYAMWWIKAAIQEYILHSWSLVKIGTTAAQKKLFFSLRKMKSKLDAYGEGDLSPEHTRAIAEGLSVNEKEVTDMNRRLSGGDSSLNATLAVEGDEQWQDMLVDDRANQEAQLIDLDETRHQNKLLTNALDTLNPREREILQARRLQEDPSTLEDLSQVYNISRERVRQIEAKAFEKLQGFFKGLKQAA